MKQQERRRRVRGFVWSVGAVYLALAATGLVMLVSRQPNASATRIANKGLQAAPSQPTAMQDLHESASLVILVAIVAAGGWLMVKVKQDWSGRLALVLLAAAVAAVSGMLMRYDTVQINGEFVEDIRGLGFLFDGGLDQVGFGKRLWGATTYRLLAAVHLGSALSIIGAIIVGVRDVVQVPTTAPRQGNANRAT